MKRVEASDYRSARNGKWAFEVRALFDENRVRWKVRLLSILSVHIIKCAKMRALFAENKVRVARPEQLWFKSV